MPMNTVPPLFWLPPISSDARIFDAVAERLPDGWRVVAGDMPGYGGTPFTDPATMTDMASHVLGMLDRDAIDRAVFCGHSIGGMVAIEIAAIAPDRVAGLILSGTTSRFGSRDGSFQKAFLEARLGALEGGGTMADVARAAPAEMLGDNPPAGIDARIIALFEQVPEEAYRAALRALCTFDRAEDFAKIAAPVRLIAGSEDKNAPLKTMVKMAETLPQANLVKLDGIGHMAPLEAPDIFARAVVEFMATIG